MLSSVSRVSSVRSMSAVRSVSSVIRQSSSVLEIKFSPQIDFFGIRTKSWLFCYL
jgi:hypothetical protein